MFQQPWILIRHTTINTCHYWLHWTLFCLKHYDQLMPQRLFWRVGKMRLITSLLDISGELRAFTQGYSNYDYVLIRVFICINCNCAIWRGTYFTITEEHQNFTSYNISTMCVHHKLLREMTRVSMKGSFYYYVAENYSKSLK